MLDEEVDHRLLIVVGEAVGIRADEEVRVCLGGADDVIEAAHVVIRFAQAAAVEEAVVLAEKENRLGGAGDEKVGHLQAGADDSGRVLLAVGGYLVLQVGQEGGDEAGRGGHGEAVFVGPQPGGHGAAAGVAGEADASFVDFGAAQQIVEGADAVPGAPGAEPFADQFELLAHHVVGVGAAGDDRSLLQAPVLVALSLVEGVVDEDDEAVAGEALAELLVEGFELANAAVTAGAENGGCGSVQFCGDVEMGGNQATGATLEEDLLDAVVGGFNTADDLWIEGGTARVRGKGAANRPAHFLLIGDRLAAGADAVEAFLADLKSVV